MLINICPQNNKHVFDDYFVKLELDLKILIFCLGASVFIPYLREMDIPLLEYPKWEFLCQERDYLPHLKYYPLHCH